MIAARTLRISSVMLSYLLVARPDRAQNRPQPIRLTGAVITRVCGMQFRNINAEPETDFLTTDPRVCLSVGVAGLKPGDKIRIQWIDPFGAVLREDALSDPNANAELYSPVWINGKDAGNRPGDWKVNILANQQGLGIREFHIRTPQNSVLNLAGPSE